jgi:hypothetical protein
MSRLKRVLIIAVSVIVLVVVLIVALYAFGRFGDGEVDVERDNAEVPWVV